MHKKIWYILILSALAVFILSACNSPASEDKSMEASAAGEVAVDDTVVVQPAEKPEVQEDTENSKDAESAEDLANDEDSANTDHSELQDAPLFEPNVLYEADFELPDCRGLGYTNLVDFYNDYPNGRPGGTFGNAGLMVHYRDDLDKDLSLEESLSFRTYRGIGLGYTLDEVFDAYGTAEIKPPFPEVMGMGDTEHTITCFVDYTGKIESGAFLDIRFYFDQNDTVMFIDYGAIYAQYASSPDVNDVVINE